MLFQNRADNTGAVLVNCASTFYASCCGCYMRVFIPIKFLHKKKCKLGDPEINVGGYVDSEDDFIIGSKKMLIFRKLIKNY